jgi:GT2 family glycosyltransferase
MKNTDIVFSIIVPTISKDSILVDLHDWFLKLDVLNCELIIIDQWHFSRKNLFQIKNKNILYLFNERKGLSLNRNIGIKASRGRWLIFLDDNCWFEKNYISVAKKYFKNNPDDGIVFSKILDEEKINTNRVRDKRKNINLISIDAGSAPGMIVRKDLALSKLFDEEMGIGGKYGSCEEFDLVARSLEEGEIVKVNPDLTIFHPEPKSTSFSREYNYGRGHGYLIYKRLKSTNQIYLNSIFSFKRIILALLKGLLGVFQLFYDFRKGRLKINWFKGFIEGFFKS